MAELTEIEKLQETARRYENLGYAVKSAQGQEILNEINAILKQVKSLLYNTAMKNIPFPYEYTKDELQQQKQYRAQLEVLNEVVSRLNYDECIRVSSSYKQKAESLIKDIPLKASY